jgi:hypothetical protein
MEMLGRMKVATSVLLKLLYAYATNLNKIAVMYFTICAVAGATFVFCGSWIYHYVDLGFDVHNDDKDNEEIESVASISPRDTEFSPSELMPQAFDFNEAVSYVRPGSTHRT